MNSRPVPVRRKRFFSSFSLRNQVNEIAIALWTSLSFYVMYLMNGNQFGLMAPLILGVVWFVWTTINKPVLARVDPWLSLGAAGLIFSILGSYLFNANRFEPVAILGNLGASIILFITLYTIVRKIEFSLRNVLIWQTLFILPLFPSIIHTAHDQFGRMMPSFSTANYVGMMGVMGALGGFAARNIFAVALLSAIPLYIMAAMQSRNSMLAVMIISVFLIWDIVRNIPRPKLRKYLLLGGLFGPIVVIGLYFVGIDLIGKVYDTFAGLFMLNDKYRGLDSGGSGRGMLWAAAWNLFMTHPWFGVGFKSVDDLMPENLPTHNAYLDVLAELGAVGFVFYMTMIVASLVGTFRRGSKMPDYALRLAIVISYIIYGDAGIARVQLRQHLLRPVSTRGLRFVEDQSRAQGQTGTDRTYAGGGGFPGTHGRHHLAHEALTRG